MRIAYVAAGAGDMYCGACHRDAALFRALAASGHELLAIPLYTPLRLDQPLACTTSSIFLGGIGLYLGQAVRLFRHLPAPLRRQFDRPTLLRRASRLGIQTAPAKLGPLTVGMLQGTAGPHVAEIQRLIQFLRDDFRPDIINLSNSLLASLAPPLRAALDVPIVCTLQGEESFIEALPEPHRTTSLDLLRGHASAIDRFTCCARQRLPAMAEFLQVPAERFAIIPTGLDHHPFTPPAIRRPPTETLVLGYLSSIRPEKGLDLLIEALRQLIHTHHCDVRLEIAGQILDKAYWQRIGQTIRKAGLESRITYHGVPDLAAKVAFLHACDLFIMPTRLPESRALAAMEALAAGLPVIAAHHGVLPELLKQTAGGITVAPDDPAALTQAILHLAAHPELRRQYAQAGPAAIAQHYTPQAMAQRTLAQYEDILNCRRNQASHSPSLKQATSAGLPLSEELRT